MREKMAMALRRLADKIDRSSLVWAIAYIKAHPGLTAAEMREVIGRKVITTKL
jgi:hypothetical protein